MSQRGFQGPRGKPGTRGHKGSPGRRGPRGVEGIGTCPGPQGPAGEEGPQGTVGTQGDQGATGFQGDVGTQGADGAQGSNAPLNQVGGPQGLPGKVGSRGKQGPRGTQGLNGTNLAFGFQGRIGFQGQMGTQSASGPQGQTGTDGTDGAQGISGAQGPDAELAPTGAQGSAGAQSAEGAQGAQGFEGQSGAQGQDGAQGPTGDFGNAGSQGSEGMQGLLGIPGSIGQQGNRGAQSLAIGTQGMLGAQGFSGAQGQDGAQGTQGNQGHFGAQGQDGFQGTDNGAQGAQGIVGYAGPQGQEGSDPGQDGAQGSRGTQGSSGIGGPQGLQGQEDGPQGILGSQGDVGSQGQGSPDGAQGFLGQDGSQGDAGDEGPQGFAGANGNDGAQGFVGSQGALGTQGSETQGPQGNAPGPQGAPGLAASRGSQGQDGSQGDVGSEGPQGFQAQSGPQGSSGFSGPQGYRGDDGAQGPQGTSPQGAQGTDGAQGFPGSQGFFGAQGLPGTQGQAGFQGCAGAQGSPGPQGFQGSCGAQGDVGAQGAQGYEALAATAAFTAGPVVLGVFEGPQGSGVTAIDSALGVIYTLNIPNSSPLMNQMFGANFSTFAKLTGVATTLNGTDMIQALVNPGSNSALFVSSNGGVTWTDGGAAAFGIPWTGVCSSSSGNVRAACGGDGGVSASGIVVSVALSPSWTLISNTTSTTTWLGIASDQTSPLASVTLVAWAGLGGVWSSTDGTGQVWSAMTMPLAAQIWTGASVTATGAVFLACARSTTLYTTTSPTGTSWTSIGPVKPWLGCVVTGPSVGNVAYLGWTNEEIVASFDGGATFYALAHPLVTVVAVTTSFDASRICAFGTVGDGNGNLVPAIAFSQDQGATWVVPLLSGVANLSPTALAMSNDAQIVVAGLDLDDGKTNHTTVFVSSSLATASPAAYPGNPSFAQTVLVPFSPPAPGPVVTNETLANVLNQLIGDVNNGPVAQYPLAGFVLPGTPSPVANTNSVLLAIENLASLLNNNAVTQYPLTGFVAGAASGPVVASDSLLTAIIKLATNTGNGPLFAYILTSLILNAPGSVNANGDSLVTILQKIIGNVQNTTIVQNALTGFASADVVYQPIAPTDTVVQAVGKLVAYFPQGSTLVVSQSMATTSISTSGFHPIVANYTTDSKDWVTIASDPNVYYEPPYPYQPIFAVTVVGCFALDPSSTALAQEMDLVLFFNDMQVPLQTPTRTNLSSSLLLAKFVTRIKAIPDLPANHARVSVQLQVPNLIGSTTAVINVVGLSIQITQVFPSATL